MTKGKLDPIDELIEVTREQAVDTLTAALIVAAGRPHSIAEAIEIAGDVRFALFPAPGAASYKEWLKTKDARLAKIRA